MCIPFEALLKKNGPVSTGGLHLVFVYLCFLRVFIAAVALKLVLWYRADAPG